MLKRIVYGGSAAALIVGAYLLGSVTLGSVLAQTPTPPPTTPAESRPASDQGRQHPVYTSSITVPREQQHEQSEADEAKALAGQATITPEQAKAAALIQFSGATVRTVELDNENGALVYSVALTDATGAGYDVKVDAGTGRVVHVAADGPEDHEGADDD